MVLEVREAGPDRGKADSDTGSSLVRVDREPEHGNDGTTDDGESTEPVAIGRLSRDGEGDVKPSTCRDRPGQLDALAQKQ